MVILILKALNLNLIYPQRLCFVVSLFRSFVVSLFRCFVVFIYSLMFIFRYFSGCVSHLSLIIVLNQISVFILLEAATGRSPTK